jgi:PhzF family phenazine biosynthesis protein
MATARLHHIDAFTDRAFTGAATPVVVVDRPIDRTWAIALTIELNQTVTAFLRPNEGGCEVRFFAATGELGLVGHAGHAAGFVALERLFPDRDRIVLANPVGGAMPVEREDGAIVLDLGAMPARAVPEVPHLDATLGHIRVVERLMADFGSVAVLDDEAAVRALRPDLARALDVPGDAVIVTARGRDADFVSRVFAPKENLPEDPVCGTAHRILVPYWAGRLGRARLSAHQVSWRGGHFRCESRGDRVRLGGRAVVVFEGTIAVPPARPGPGRR